MQNRQVCCFVVGEKIVLFLQFNFALNRFIPLSLIRRSISVTSVYFPKWQTLLSASCAM